MTISRFALAASAGLTLFQSQLAQAATTPASCLSEAEVTALVGYALPAVIGGTMKSCKPHLATNGYFATRGTEFLGRYAARKEANWPMAKAAFLKLGSTKDSKMVDTIANMPDEAVQPFVEGIVSEMVGSEIKPTQCTAIERGVRLLSPLPPENTAELVTFVLVLSDKPKPGKTSSFPICKTAA
ncbi:MAG: hypothetical protein B7X90_13460 [Novosphingobium sp. 17-62-19]|uniref:hypothetical protein n=1 Tax=Novosphingobium sp. 17-62-19 TaxID=1970406 RepID=UPI000BC9E5B0|nr:hypothetical protein [Novosphingobium sp. 17-62-19]OYX92905.1 MAG: hypothetical protein B7Y74_11015 [Novosphingobium sp. 35-62-5]OZA17897.1 MAG: hypothetical protein B7X90_13460 [Novosphingobium sp. 17-62-19]HQS97879.1 hypothetical protein [Novosphingobium sp.]